MKPQTIKPTVNAAREFKEIASDFGSPLDLLRESISNSFDAKASHIKLTFSTVEIKGRSILKIVIEDNGLGMDLKGLQSFFDLGNSFHHDDKERSKKEGLDDATLPIGEKGHGTKVFLNSSHVTVATSQNGKKYVAEMMDPYAALSDDKVPFAEVQETETTPGDVGTTITILGYNHDQTELFNHERLKDHIRWFTKFGSSEAEFGINIHKEVKLSLKGLDRKNPEVLNFGHIFPQESGTMQELFEKHDERASDMFCKRFKFEGTLPRLPAIAYQAIFYVEGNKVKQDYNGMIKRPGRYVAPNGAYTVADRYGIWLCKDFIPVERRNGPISYKGTEFRKLHAFFNCQSLRLSANRGSIEPTPETVKNAIDEEIKSIYAQIMDSEDIELLDYFETPAEAKRTIEKEKKEFKKRQERAERADFAEYKGVTLIEPQSEIGVLAMMVQLSVVESELFPFTIIDYDTHSGYDVLVKGDSATPIQNARKFYVEYKHLLSSSFNHSFQNLKCIVCWNTKLRHDDEISDITDTKRTLQIHGVGPKGSYTKYFLHDPGDANRIEVFVLKFFLKEKLGIEFKPRTATSVR